MTSAVCSTVCNMHVIHHVQLLIVQNMSILEEIGGGRRGCHCWWHPRETIREGTYTCHTWYPEAKGGSEER